MQVEVTHLFSTTKCIQTGHPLGLSVAQRTGLGLTRLPLTPRTVTRYEARHERAILVLYSNTMLKNGKNPGVSMAPLQQPTRA